MVKSIQKKLLKVILEVTLTMIFIILLPIKANATNIESPSVSYPIDGQEYQLNSFKVDWLDNYNADYYLISLRDITVDKLLVNRKKVYSSCYTISKTNFKYGHNYRVAVAAVDNAKEGWTEVEFCIEKLVVEQPEIVLPGGSAEVEPKE